MDTVVTFPYRISEAVRIRAIDTIGRVDALTQDIQGKMFRVVYWNDGGRYQVWMYEWELEPIPLIRAEPATAAQ